MDDFVLGVVVGFMGAVALGLVGIAYLMRR